MKTIRAIIILIFGLILICCKNEMHKSTDTEIIESQKSDVEIEESNFGGEYLITEKGVLGINVDEPMPVKLENYEIKKSSFLTENGNTIIEISITENNTELLELELDFDYDKLLNYDTIVYTNKIKAIYIADKRFKTEKNIGLESTLIDFISAYPDYQIEYLGLYGDSFKLESNDINNILFYLDPNGYIGKRLMGADHWEEVKKEDFIKDTKIRGITIIKN